MNKKSIFVLLGGLIIGGISGYLISHYRAQMAHQNGMGGGMTGTMEDAMPANEAGDGAGMDKMGVMNRIDLATPQGRLQALRKDMCSLEDGAPVYYTWSGALYARRRGEPDVKLFNLVGMNVRQCTTVTDEARGTGFRGFSREIMLYLDPKTNKPLDKWHNPWLGRDVDVVHVANDPVNFPPFYPLSKTGKPSVNFPAHKHGNSWYDMTTIPLFYHNVLGGDYQRYVGGAYHAVEMFASFGSLADLTDANKPTTQVHGGAWSRISDYLPWMEMQGREGVVYAHAITRKVPNYGGLPAILRDYIETKAPIYKTPPPASDMRPNETSWSVFKNKVPGEKLPRGGYK